MNEKYNELKLRIEKLLERENAIKSELDELYSMNRTTDLDTLNSLEKEVDAIYTSEVEILKPKCDLLDMYYEADEYIKRLSSEELNKSVRTKLIKKLQELLLQIKKLDEVVVYDEEEVSILYTERNNAAIFNKQLEMFSNVVDGSITILHNEINNELNRLEKGKVEEKPRKGKIGKIICSVALVAAILFAVKSCSKKDGKILPTKATVDDPKSSEELLTLESNNDNNTIVIPTAEPVTIVENTEEAVNEKEDDLVRRSNEIAKTNFFEDAYASDIVDVLRAIADKQMWSTENAGYAQAFNTTFNRTVDHYLFGEINEEDINKVEALRYLAKDNSDLDRFLERYATLLEDILRNPSDQSKKDEMGRFITIFATSLNGFTNEPEVLTDDEAFNENAQVNDYLNWWFAYDSIIKPTYPMFYPKELEEVDGTIVELLMYMNNEQKDAYLEEHGLTQYKDAILKQIKLYELQYLMESTLVNHPLFCEIRSVNDGPVLTLGGED